MEVHVPSAGARLIIEEAMKADERPLYVALLGAATDLASALLMRQEIAGRLTAVWIGGGDYPEGGWKFNLAQDVHAANVLLSSRAAHLYGLPVSARAERPGDPHVSHGGRAHDDGGFLCQAGAASNEAEHAKLTGRRNPHGHEDTQGQRDG